MAQQLDIIEGMHDGLSDALSITQSLLGRPSIPPRRRTSFTSTNRSGHTREVSKDCDESTGIRDEGGRRGMTQSSNTWTNSSAEIFSEKDDVEDRTFFVLEYNRLATKHGVRTLIAEDIEPSYIDTRNGSNKSGSWFSRKILRRTSSSQSFKLKTERLTKHRRSISDLSLRLKSKSDKLKDKDLQELVRLCGLSLLYLPTEYAVSSLAVPTCFRATAQYLVQHASTARGIFRIPGSHNTVAALYNHYCTMDEHGAVVAETVRCPTLPEHIRCDVHDVASAFKKFISRLPGGILGSLSLFDAFISIQSQLNSMPELTRTKQSKVRARLIALAVATLRSQFRRELICAVFGLLNMIGRAAEIAPRENERGRPLPTSDLMGYGALGIVFGPLLIGDMLENYTMHLANPRGGLVILPISPPKSRKERSKRNKTSEDCSAYNTHVDKIKIANSITEMLITHWRDVVRHMKNLKALKVVRSYKSLEVAAPKQPALRPSASESFALRKPPDWDNDNSPMRLVERCESPTPASRGGSLLEGRLSGRASPKSNDTLTVRKQRSRPRPMSSQILSGARSMSILSPTLEEKAECSPASDEPSRQKRTSATPSRSYKEVYPFADKPKAGNIVTSDMPKPLSPKPLREDDFQPDLLKRKKYPFSDDAAVVNQKTYDGPEATPAKATLEDNSRPVQEHALKDCPPPIEHKDCSPAKPKYLVKQPRLMGPLEPERPALSHPCPDIKIARVPSSGETKPGAAALRRIFVSEPGLRPDMHIRRPPLRSSKSSYGHASHGIAVRDWAAPRDPLTRVSVQEDLASLAELAHVLKKELPETGVEIRTAKKEITGVQKQFDESHDAKEMAPQKVIQSSYTLESQMKSNQTASALAQEKPKAIEGPNYSHLSKRTPGPKQKTPEQSSGRSGSPKILKRPSPLVSSVTTSSCEVQIENSQAPQTGSPRLSVRALAAKFNTDESRSLSAPSPTISLSKAISVDIRAVSDSPKEKIIAPYTTNPPSPTKSQKSGKSDISLHSVRIPPPVDGIFAKPSPPRRLLRSDLNDSMPLRSVPGPQEPSASQLTNLLVCCSPPGSPQRSEPAPKKPLTSQLPDIPTCCPPPGSPQRLTVYDGASTQYSTESSFEPNPCPTSPHVHFESKRSAVTSERASVASDCDSTSSIPIAINPLRSPPLTRSNSILHAQIRTLREQLNGKTEEIRHLKRQLSTRGSLDVGALSEELREAKKEAQAWKARAEVAEKQMEVMASLSSRNTSNHNTTNSSSIAPGHSSSSQLTTDCSEDGTVLARRVLCGMDGASSHPNSSECSTETVVHNVQEEVVTGSE